MNEDLISRSALLDRFRKLGFLPSIVKGNIEKAPAVDAEPIQHGHWIYEPCELEDFYCCSECDYFIRWPIDDKTFDYGYCPGCGAKMGKKVANDAEED